MPRCPLVRLVLLALAIGLLSLPAAAERLPIRAYGAAEGLAGDHVRFILQDAQGFLWLATNAGVSRFDGHEFKNYGAADGLPFPSARKVVESPDGTLYVLARQRVARRTASSAAAGAAFELVDPPGLLDLVGEVFDLAIGPDGSLVLAGSRGAGRLVSTGGAERLDRLDLGPPALPDQPSAEHVWAAAFDRSGALWVARTYGITRIGRDGERRTLSLSTDNQIGAGWGWLPSMTVDRSGRVWLLPVGDRIWRLDLDDRGGPVLAEVLDGTPGLAGSLPRAIHEDREGTLWIGTSSRALLRCESVGGRRRLIAVGPAEGLPDVEVFALATDSQGNLWGGTATSGAFRLAADGLTSWGAADGLRPFISALHEDPEEGLTVVQSNLLFVAMRGDRLGKRWGLTPGLVAGWGSQQILARSRNGRLWVATAAGVAMYPPGTRVRELASRPPERLIGPDAGLSGPQVHRVFAAGDGSVWLGLMHPGAGVCRVGGDGVGLRCFSAADGLPDVAIGAAIEDDGAGGIWVGLYDGGVFRYRAGRFETWPEVAPGAQSTTDSIRRDGQGRLWIAGAPGLLRVDHPEAQRPSFRRYTSADGLSSPDTIATAEDRFGRLYVGGVHGVDRIDWRTGTIRRFTSADGLASNRITTMKLDRAGTLWIGTSRGVSRLVPKAGDARTPPRVFLTRLSVAGRPRDPGGPLTLESDERTVEFAFTAPSFRVAESMRFQWRLHGSSDTWSSPGASRSITFAGLSPGRYRFEVRAVDGEGAISVPVAAAFTIRPPLWQRPWFLALLAVTLAAAAAVLYRVRVRRLVEIERVRTRIATDLHDDIGASLSQIAVLSQVASRQVSRGGAQATGALERITELSGGLVDAMSDVVWSINPARDRMSDLVHRMHRFAVDLFSESAATLRLDLPGDGADVKLDAEARRQVYLVFKEALRNVARHSGATSVEVSLRPKGAGLVLLVRDDGKGIQEPTSPLGGHGLGSMRRRAAAMGADLQVRSRPGGGTEVVLETSPARRSLLTWTGVRGNPPS